MGMYICTPRASYGGGVDIVGVLSIVVSNLMDTPCLLLPLYLCVFLFFLCVPPNGKA